MKLAVILITFLPTLYEAFTDRFGEKKKNKLTDGIILVGYSVLLAVGAHLSGYEWVPVIVLLLAIRFAFFDYAVNFFLKKYSPGHSDINVFTFTGTTAFTDRLTAKIPPVIRFALRLVVFAASVAYFLLS